MAASLSGVNRVPRLGSLDRERLSAPAATLGVRVFPTESVAHKAVIPVEHRAAQELETPLVDHDHEAIEVELTVPVRPYLLREIEMVGETVAPSTFHSHANSELSLTCFRELPLAHFDRAVC